MPPYEVPWVPFLDIEINLNLPEYSELWNDGGNMYIDGGVRGLIIHRESASRYICFERNCTWEANSACATVNVDASLLYLSDPCCGSIFSFETGEPIGGPAVYPLQQYKTYLQGNLLTITDEIVNW